MLLLSLAVLMLFPYGNVTTPGMLDPWMYTGYFRNLPEMIELFGPRYYASRLPYILPGYVLYAVFTPNVANLALNALLLTSILAPLWLISVAKFSRQVACVVVVAAAANAYVATTIIWDYPDGPAIAYTMLGLWLCLAPPARLRPQAALILAGAMWTMAGITNLIAGVIIVASLLTCLIARNDRWQTAASDILWITLGALICFLIWCGISKSILGIWNILEPQWRQVKYATENQSYLPDMWGRSYAWISQAYRQIPTVLLLLLGLPLWLSLRLKETNQSRLWLAVWVGLVFCCGVFAWEEFVMQKVLLRVFYHSSYVVVPLLLVFAAAVHAVLSAQPQKWLWVAGAILCVSTLLPALLRGFWHFPAQALPWLAITGTGSFLLLGTRPITVGIGGICLAVVVSMGPATDPSVGSFAFRPKEAVLFPDSTEDISAKRAAYQHEVANDLYVFLWNGGMRNRPIRFWFDQDDPAKPLFDSLHSMFLWDDNNLTRALLAQPESAVRNQFQPRSRVLHLASSQTRIDQQHLLMDKCGIRWREIGAWNLGQRGPRYRIVLDEILE